MVSDPRYKQQIHMQASDFYPPSVQLLSLQLIGDWPCSCYWTGCWSLPRGSPVHMVNIKYASVTINTSLPVWNTDTITTLVNARGIHTDKVCEWHKTCWSTLSFNGGLGFRSKKVMKIMRLLIQLLTHCAFNSLIAKGCRLCKNCQTVS
jgi:hypothetical protein